MLFTAAADLHITNKTPTNRKGDYFSQVIDKFEFILNLSENTDSKVLVVAGDFFDSAQVSYKITRRVLESIQKSDVRILAISGQHDVRYHGLSLDNTPLGILQTAKAIQILKPDSTIEINGISFMGCSWGEEPKIEADVLVMHLMVTKKGELWPGQTNYSTAHSILRKYQFAQCIISGDNHLPHALRVDNRIQINPGSMLRSTKSQINHQPRVYQINTSDWSFKKIKIPILPAEEVFDFSKITIEEMKDESKKIAEEKIKNFINTLPKNEREKPNFINILQNVIEQTKPNDAVKKIIASTIEEIS